MSKFGARRLRESQKFRFLIAGLVNTVVGYCVFIGLLSTIGAAQLVLVVALSHLVATSLSFILNRAYVFKQRGKAISSYFRFQSVYGLVLLLNLALLFAFVELFGLPILLAQAICIVFVGISSYVGHKYFSFRIPRKERTPT